MNSSASSRGLLTVAEASDLSIRDILLPLFNCLFIGTPSPGALTCLLGNCTACLAIIQEDEEPILLPRQPPIQHTSFICRTGLLKALSAVAQNPQQRDENVDEI